MPEVVLPECEVTLYPPVLLWEGAVVVDVLVTEEEGIVAVAAGGPGAVGVEDWTP